MRPEGLAAMVQARLGSSRLPGKVMADVCGAPLLARVVERVARSRHRPRIVLATTDLPEDDPIESFARDRGLGCHRGESRDVLARFWGAARRFGAETIVRVTADDPFKDPGVIDAVIDRYLAGGPEGGYDYVSNAVTPSYPEGLDVEIFSAAALARAHAEARTTAEREHVTPYIWQHPERFRIGNVAHDEDLSSLRLTVDTAEDLDFARALYGRLMAAKPAFVLSDVVGLLARDPVLKAMMPRIPRNAGYLASLEARL